jgi:Flp pilus assembly pilin Flp
MTSISLIGHRALRFLRAPASRDDGQALIEYALIVSLVALVAIAALKTTGANVGGLLNKVAGDV